MSYYWVTNSRELHGRPSHSDEVTMVCAFCWQQYRHWAFKDHNGACVAIRSDRYIDMLWSFFELNLNVCGNFRERRNLVSSRSRHNSLCKVINEIFAEEVPRTLDLAVWLWYNLACSFPWSKPLAKYFCGVTVFKQCSRTLKERKAATRRKIIVIPPDLSKCSRRQSSHLLYDYDLILIRETPLEMTLIPSSLFQTVEDFDND